MLDMNNHLFTTGYSCKILCIFFAEEEHDFFIKFETKSMHYIGGILYH